MKPIKPKTQPGNDELAVMKERLRGLVKELGGLKSAAEKLGVPYWTLSSWQTRCRIGAQAAKDICSLDVVVQTGYTKEFLRPDITNWGE